MEVRIEDADTLLGEVFDDDQVTAGWIYAGNLNLHQNEERSIIASTIALHGVKVELLCVSEGSHRFLNPSYLEFIILWD